MKNRQTQIEGWGRGIQIWSRSREMQNGAGGQGRGQDQGWGPGNTNTCKKVKVIFLAKEKSPFKLNSYRVQSKLCYEKQ